MSLRDDLETIDPAADVQKAFDNSNGSDGRNAWTISRHSAALSMGCEVMKAIGPDTEGLMAHGTYSNVLRDVIIAMWLCSLPDEEVMQLNARLVKESAIARAFAWAEAEGLSYGSAKFFEGTKLLSKIVSDILASFYAIEGNSKPEPPLLKKNTNRRGKSDSPTSRRSGRDTQQSIA